MANALFLVITYVNVIYVPGSRTVFRIRIRIQKAIEYGFIGTEKCLCILLIPGLWADVNAEDPREEGDAAVHHYRGHRVFCTRGATLNMMSKLKSTPVPVRALQLSNLGNS